MLCGSQEVWPNEEEERDTDKFLLKVGGTLKLDNFKMKSTI